LFQTQRGAAVNPETRSQGPTLSLLSLNLCPPVQLRCGSYFLRTSRLKSDRIFRSPPPMSCRLPPPPHPIAVFPGQSQVQVQMLLFNLGFSPSLCFSFCSLAYPAAVFSAHSFPPLFFKHRQLTATDSLSSCVVVSSTGPPESFLPQTPFNREVPYPPPPPPLPFSVFRSIPQDSEQLLVFFARRVDLLFLSLSALVVL